MTAWAFLVIEDSKFNRLDKTLTGRLTLWDAGKSMFISSPISGVGAKNYREAFPLFSKEGYPLQVF